MADVQFAPPLQRLTSPPGVASAPPPPPPPAPAFEVSAALPATPPPPLRLSEPVPQVKTTNSVPTISLQDFLQPGKSDSRPVKRKKKRGKKLLFVVVFLGLMGGGLYYFRDTEPIQQLLHRDQAAAPLPDVPFDRPGVTSAEYSITLSAVENGVPKNITTRVKQDYRNTTGQTTTESQVGGLFTTTQEIRTRDAVFRPGLAFGKEWSRQPIVPEAPSPYDVVEFIPMIDDIVDQPLREAVQPKSSKAKEVDGVTISTLTYVLDRAKVPEIAPAIFARVPWLFDVPNATTLTVEVSYDETGLVRHLFLGVEPPQPGTGSGATWVTSYLLDVLTVNAPVDIPVPLDVVDVPVGTP